MEAVRNICHFCFIVYSSIIEIWEMGWQGKSRDLKLEALMDPYDDYKRFSDVGGSDSSSCQLSAANCRY